MSFYQYRLPKNYALPNEDYLLMLDLEVAVIFDILILDKERFLSS